MKHHVGISNIDSSEEEEKKKEEQQQQPPVETSKEIVPQCQICHIMVLNKDMVGDSGAPEGRYLQLTATARSDGSKHVFYFCDKCRFNEVLINQCSQEYQKILSDMDYKVIQGVHN